jgi:hypothetical protein
MNSKHYTVRVSETLKRRWRNTKLRQNSWAWQKLRYKILLRTLAKTIILTLIIKMKPMSCLKSETSWLKNQSKRVIFS